MCWPLCPDCRVKLSRGLTCFKCANQYDILNDPKDSTKSRLVKNGGVVVEKFTCVQCNCEQTAEGQIIKAGKPLAVEPAKKTKGKNSGFRFGKKQKPAQFRKAEDEDKSIWD